MLSSFLFGFSTGALLLPTFLRDSFYLVLLFISFFSLSLRGGGEGEKGKGFIELLARPILQEIPLLRVKQNKSM